MVVVAGFVFVIVVVPSVVGVVVIVAGFVGKSFCFLLIWIQSLKRFCYKYSVISLIETIVLIAVIDLYRLQNVESNLKIIKQFHHSFLKSMKYSSE